MAGYRRGTGRPLTAVLRAERRNRALTERLANANTPLQRLTAAFDYLRGALARSDPQEAARIADELTRTLIGTAREATQAEINRRKRELSNHDHDHRYAA